MIQTVNPNDKDYMEFIAPRELILTYINKYQPTVKYND